jgi:hypothetical protein
MAESPPQQQSKEETKTGGNISILGQMLEYPKTGWGFCAVFVVCLTLLLTIYVYLHAPRENVHEFSVMIWHLNSKNEPTPEKKVARYEFWTPSSKTKETVKDNPKAKAWLKKDWNYDEKITEFGERLREQPGVEGYRRHEILGEGRTSHPGLLPGWWWTVRVTDEFSLKKLSEFYRGFWENPDTIYVETFNADASFQQ